MRQMSGFRTLTLIILLLSLCCVAVFSQKRSELTNDSRPWIDSTLSTWQTVRKDALKIPRKKTPWTILFDDSRAIHLNPDVRLLQAGIRTEKMVFAGETVYMFAVSHDGMIRLPDTGEVPAQLLSFAAPYDGGQSAYVISALPSIWRKAPHLANEANIDKLAASVFIHEMTHTLHLDFYDRLTQAEKRLDAADEIDDNIIQNKFGKNDEFRAMLEAEKAMLFRAADERDRRQRKLMAGRALKMINERRNRFFVGKDAPFRELEEIFLTMEGAANWAAYKGLVSQGLLPAESLRLIRRGGKYWSQDEGLALFLVIDSLLSGWQQRAFAKKNSTAFELLAAAVKIG